MDPVKFLNLLGGLEEEPVKTNGMHLEEANRIIVCNAKITHPIFNRILLYCAKKTVTESFFRYFFGEDISGIEKLEEGITHFRKRAMLLFGNFKTAFEVLSDLDNVEEYIKKKGIKSFSPLRPRLNDILDDIPDHKDRYCLGYKFDPIGKCKNLEERIPKASTPEETEGLRKELNKIKELVEIGKRNTIRYLTLLEDLDVYIATSMREPEDFESISKLIDDVFKGELKDLNLYYFDPTLSYIEDPRKKGLIECLMLKRAKMAIYCAQGHDSYGKDSELATMLIQGKPAIVYIPQIGKNGNETKNFEERAKFFKDIHPLSLQVDIKTGVAHGFVVVRAHKDCAKILSDLLNDTLLPHLTIKEDEFNYYLEEERTQSVIRVVTKDRFLTNAFWNYYHRE